MGSKSSTISGIDDSVTPEPGFLNPKKKPVKSYFGAWTLATVTSILACVLIGVIGWRKTGYQWITYHKDLNERYAKNVDVKDWLKYHTHAFWEKDNRTKQPHINPSKMFTYHPLFMTISMLFMQSQAAMMYRTLRHEKFSRFTIKLFHAGFQYGTFVLMVLGLNAVFVFHKIVNYPTLSDAHGWLGIIVAIFFTLQLIFGTVAFLFPGASYRVRHWYVTYHRFFGAVLIMVSAVVACMGMAMWQVTGWSVDAIMCRVYVLSVIVYAVCMAFTVANEEFIVRNSATDSEKRSLYAGQQSPAQYTEG